MKIPTWAVIIGICMILFGGCSVTSNVQSIFLPDMIDMQKSFMSGFMNEIPINKPGTTVLDSTYASDSSVADSAMANGSISSDNNPLTKPFLDVLTVSEFSRK